MKKTLSGLRLNEKIVNHMDKAIKEYNESSMFPVSESEFRRMAIELLSQFVLQKKPMPFKVTL